MVHLFLDIGEKWVKVKAGLNGLNTLSLFNTLPRFKKKRRKEVEGVKVYHPLG